MRFTPFTLLMHILSNGYVCDLDPRVAAKTMSTNYFQFSDVNFA